jgi:hypothetical protein
MIRPTLHGQMKLPLETGVRFDAGHFLSLLAARLERSGASVRRHGASIDFEDLRPWGSRRAVTWCEGVGAIEDRETGPVLRYSLRFGGVGVLAAVGVASFIGISLWKGANRPLAGYLVVVLGTVLGVLTVEALAVLIWFRWAARRTARDLTHRPPRAAA